MIAAQSGDQYKAIRKQARRRKDKAALEQLDRDAPEGDDDPSITFFSNIFLMCEADRRDGQSHIPLTTMITVCQFFELDEYQEDFLFSTFAIADNIVLADRRTRQPNGNPSATVNPNEGARRKSSRNR